MAKAAKYVVNSLVKCENKGQAQQVYNALMSSDNSPKTCNEVAALLEENPEFKTRQTSERIAAYYICVFKKAGLVRPVEVTTELSLNDNENEVYEIE